MKARFSAGELTRGVRCGIPIGLGYLAVAFTLGITARNAGLTAWEAALTSLLVNASAGEYAAFTLIAANAGYWEIALIELVANARYLLMSCALSQKLPEEEPLYRRLLIGFDVTDELFALSVTQPGPLNFYFYLGMMAVALPGWAGGTFLGVVVGSILPAAVVRALGVGLYGMFLAVMIPAARKSRVILGVVAGSMAASYAFSVLPTLATLSSGTRTILLTVVISALAALLFPVRKEAVDAA
ncbi:MAG: AzlC family ABC transporter permease [Oscillospiraceae bacterium]|nr:AzlC family ABC transporter permease [Oscillospiraceae bacterium]